MTYQWLLNGTPIPGATSATYTTPAVTLADNGSQYSVTVSDAAGSVTSSVTTLDVSFPCLQTSGPAWTNQLLPVQSAPFTAAFDATPSQADADITMGLSLGSASAYTNLAAIVRFNPSGDIDVRNGANYTADFTVPYGTGVIYHFVMLVDPTTQLYTVYVSYPGQSQIALATAYSFRSEQAGLTTINDLSLEAAPGSVSLCNLTVAASSTGLGSASSGSTGSTTSGSSGSGSSGTQPVGGLGSVLASLTFGNVNLGATQTQAVALTNSGATSTTITNMVIAGTGFSVSGISTGQILAAGQSITLTVTFAPSSAGTVTGSITISNTTQSPAVIALAGSGVAPASSVSHSVTLSWNPDAGAASYNVYRGSTPVSLTKIDSASVNAYSDASVASGQTYYYAVTAVNSAGIESGYSNQATATVP